MVATRFAGAITMLTFVAVDVAGRRREVTLPEDRVPVDLVIDWIATDEATRTRAAEQVLERA